MIILASLVALYQVTFQAEAFTPQAIAVRETGTTWRSHNPNASGQKGLSNRSRESRRGVVPGLPTFKAETGKSVLSATGFIAFDIIFRRLFQYYRIAFPSSLACCAVLFLSLLTLPTPAATAVFQALRPGALLLAKWLPLFFVPSLIMLPLADPIPMVELVKTTGVIIGGLFFTLFSTSWSVVVVRKLRRGSAKKIQRESFTSRAGVPTSSTLNTVRPIVPNVANGGDSPPTKPIKAFSTELFNLLALSTTLSGAVAVTTGGAKSLFLLSATFLSFVLGARLPVKFTKWVNPLVTCTALTWAATWALGMASGHSFQAMLKMYRTGSLTMGSPGDLLLFLLGPAVVSLAISMYDRRQLMWENLAEVATSIGVSTMGGLFGTALAVRLLGIGSPSLRLSLLSRNITSPLAMAIAGMMGADISLAVSFVVVTGLLGASFGARLLDSVGITDAVARGLGIGAAAHGLGTAAFSNEKDAFPFAAIAMALTASGATVAVSIPFLKRMLLQLALG